MNLKLRYCKHHYSYRLLSVSSKCALNSIGIGSSSLNVQPKVVVVGAGHAGIEAAAAAARCGVETIMITERKESIGTMSCNPSFGGIGKGTLVREIDALDGLCGRICDKSGIAWKALNRSKGAAVLGLRAQIDRSTYMSKMQDELKTINNLQIIEASVEDLILRELPDSRKLAVDGVVLSTGDKILATSVILATGTFLGGEIHIGHKAFPGGRIGESPTTGLNSTLRNAGFKVSRLKTGTPPRIKMSSIDFSRLVPQENDLHPIPFSFLSSSEDLKNTSRCFITRTNEETHKIVRDNLEKSLHIRETVKGPRYCPSFEAKVIRFADRNSHLIWLEPEGIDLDTCYPNGISTSMPEEIQEKILRSIEGLQNCQISQYGYGVEYDFVDPRQIHPTLETKLINGLFLAGQINGTTGYEEAAAQGILSGLNGALYSQKREQVILPRDSSYIGVMIDDLTVKGVEEPYRVFTARSEDRMHLRADNADSRLTELGYKSGCVTNHRYENFLKTKNELQDLECILKSFKQSSSAWKKHGINLSNSGKHFSAWDIMEFYYDIFPILDAIIPEYKTARDDIKERLRSEGRYQFRIKQEATLYGKMRKQEESFYLPDSIDYTTLPFLSTEQRESFVKFRPRTLAQVRRLQGTTPYMMYSLWSFLTKGKHIQDKELCLTSNSKAC